MLFPRLASGNIYIFFPDEALAKSFGAACTDIYSISALSCFIFLFCPYLAPQTCRSQARVYQEEGHVKSTLILHYCKPKLLCSFAKKYQWQFCITFIFFPSVIWNGLINQKLFTWTRKKFFLAVNTLENQEWLLASPNCWAAVIAA